MAFNLSPELLAQTNVGMMLALPQVTDLLPESVIEKLEQLPADTKLTDIPGELWILALADTIAGKGTAVQHQKALPGHSITRCRNCGFINYYEIGE